jgi:glutamate carboxypeptidase
MSGEQLVRSLEEQQGRLLAELEELVARETPSDDKGALDAFAEFLAHKVGTIDGARVDLVSAPGNGNHVRAEWAGRPGEKPVLLLGHYDTVWPVGTLARMPFRTEDGRAYGPGVLDMKAGLLQALWGIRVYREHGGDRPLVLLVTSDEEIGSESSRGLIETEARGSSFVLVFEPALADGSLKTSRRGLSRYRIDVAGRASHSGLAPESGVNAIEELCELIGSITGLAEPRRGTDVNVGLIEGGTRFNVVAARAGCEVSFRMNTRADADRIADAVSRLRPRRPGAAVDVTGGLLWPPMEPSAAGADLAMQATALAGELGFELRSGHAGGSSDGCHCAAVGATVLDGLGAVGGGAHAEDEHVLVAAIPARIALLVRMLETATSP